MYNWILPAPGTYSPEKMILGKGPSYSLSGKPHPEKPNDIPGINTKLILILKWIFIICFIYDKI